MNQRKLKNIRAKLMEMRKSPANRKPREFISIAKQLGRIEQPRGKEPTYVRTHPWLSSPLSIPNHSSVDYKRATALNIIDALLSDVDEWELFLLEADHD
jgi:hypothetical protein